MGLSTFCGGGIAEGGGGGGQNRTVNEGRKKATEVSSSQIVWKQWTDIWLWMNPQKVTYK